MERRSVIVGYGGRLPSKVLTNADIAAMVDTTDDWIVERTGIRQRHIAGPGEKTSDLAIAAARAAPTGPARPHFQTQSYPSARQPRCCGASLLPRLHQRRRHHHQSR